MTEVDFESDAFLSLLTDALRAGPGSPQWHQAVRQLRGGGIAHGDEYSLLVRAREHLESGKQYRSVRAGPAFTEKLMTAIDEQANGASVPKPATSATVAVASAAIMLVALLVVGYLLWNAAERGAGTGSTTLLTDAVTTIGSTATLPADWKPIGSMSVEVAKSSIKPATQLVPSQTGGGLFWQREVGPAEPFAAVASLKLSTRTSDDLIPQIFITDEPEFSPENGTTAHELVWLLRGRQVQLIAPGGQIQTQFDLPPEIKDTFYVRITIDQKQASLDLNGKRVWSGENGLSGEKSRYVGMRFLRRGQPSGAPTDTVIFQAVKVNMRQK